MDRLADRQVWIPAVGQLSDRHAHLDRVDACEDRVARAVSEHLHPSRRPPSRSATSLTKPPVYRLTIARGTCSRSSTRHLHSSPCSRASASVMPAEAIVGFVNVMRGRAE